jgi:polygalacturonase
LAGCGGADGEAVSDQQQAATAVPKLATGDSRKVSQPTFPGVCTTLSAQFSSSSRSSPPSSDDTSRIQSALNGCKGTGKSVVLAASGSHNAFFSSTVTVSGEALVVNSGVTLFGSNKYSGELVAVSGTNAAIMGPGTIDGRGDLISGTPRLVQAKKITNFIAFDITLQHAAKEHLYVEGGNGFTAWNVTIATPANTKNTDGIDIDSMTNATVNDCFIEDGDDGVAIKTNQAGASNITVSNSTFHGTHGMSIGSQTFDGVTNVLWQNNTVFGSDQFGNVSTNNNGINIKSDPSCGGKVQQVTYNHTCMTGVKHLLTFNTSFGSCSGTAGTPQYTDIVVNGVLATKSQSGAFSEFDGFSSSAALGVTLENVDLDVTAEKTTENASVGLFNSNIKPSGSNVSTFTVAGSGSVPSCTF